MLALRCGCMQPSWLLLPSLRTGANTSKGACPMGGGGGYFIPSDGAFRRTWGAAGSGAHNREHGFPK